jgi:mycothiol synthase
MQHSERAQIWMTWPENGPTTPIDPRIPDRYFIRTYRPGDEDGFLALMAQMDFDSWAEEKLDYNISKALPAGWFFAVEIGSNEPVATAMCLHNYYGRFPFTGDLGWLACHATHRGKGLGFSLAASVTNRFHEAGYSKIQLRTEYYRLPAIKTYLKLGYVPYLYCHEVYGLWEEICEKLKWPYHPHAWPRPETPTP